jgi:hypothetical protein
MDFILKFMAYEAFADKKVMIVVSYQTKKKNEIRMTL